MFGLWTKMSIFAKQINILMNQNTGNIIRSSPAATCWCGTSVTTCAGMMMGRMFMA